jgi:hypothetical protein
VEARLSLRVADFFTAVGGEGKSVIKISHTCKSKCGSMEIQSVKGDYFFSDLLWFYAL